MRPKGRRTQKGGPMWTAVSELVRPATSGSLITHIEVDNSVGNVTDVLAVSQPDKFAQYNRLDLCGIIVGFFYFSVGEHGANCLATA